MERACILSIVCLGLGNGPRFILARRIEDSVRAYAPAASKETFGAKRGLSQHHGASRATGPAGNSPETVLGEGRVPRPPALSPAWTLTFPRSGSALQGIARKIQEAHVPTKGWTLQLKHKLLQAMRERDKRFPLEGIVQIDDAYSGGQRRGGKRGRTGCACAGCGASARPPCGAGPSVISSRARGSIPTGCAASAAWPRPAVSTW